MGANPNSLSAATYWTLQYEVTHYTQPVFQAFATERLETTLVKGATVKRTYASDSVVNKMGNDGSYATQALTDTDESLTVSTILEDSFRIPDWNLFQTHLPTVQEYSTKAMARIWDYVDGTLLQNMQQNYGSYMDDGTLGGVSGNGIVASVGSVQNLFATAEEVLIKNNVKYIPGKRFAGIPMNTSGLITACAIPPELNNVLTQYVASKNTALGDKTFTNGFMGYALGFNVFVSNNLPWDAVLSISVNPTNGDTFTLLNGVTIAGVSQAMTYTFVNSIGATAGNILIAGSATLTITNIVSLLNNNVTTANGVAYTVTTVYQQKLINAMTAVKWSSYGVTSGTGTLVDIQVFGFGNVPLAVSFTSASNVIQSQFTHAIFATSKSIDLVMQARPRLYKNFVSNSVAKDFVTWNLFGYKVFQDQLPQIIDVRLNASGFLSPVVQWL